MSKREEEIEAMVIALDGLLDELAANQALYEPLRVNRLKLRIFDLQTQLSDALPEYGEGEALVVVVGDREFAICQSDGWPKPFALSSLTLRLRQELEE